MHFTREYIDELLDRVDIVDVFRRYGVDVKIGSGKNIYYTADFCCGKSSMNAGRIKKETNTFKCNSCGASGNAIHFLTKYQNKTFRDAVLELAEIGHMELPSADPEQASIQKKQEDRKHRALRLAADFYHAQNNFDYFLSRGISMDILKKYKAGYAPGGRALRNHLQAVGYTKEELAEYKLINQKGLDRFFYRAVIPIVMNGKVVDLYGRATDEKPSSIPHLYLYGDVLFLGGYDNLKSGTVVLMTESYIDQLVAESYGYNATSTGGAHKFTPEHARLLKKRGTNRMVIAYDGDRAGQEGSLHVGELLEAVDIDTHIARLPVGEDPASILSQEGLPGFRAKLNSREYKIAKMEHFLDGYSIEEIETYLIQRKQADI